jgi:hypothetical protein
LASETLSHFAYRGQIDMGCVAHRSGRSVAAGIAGFFALFLQPVDARPQAAVPASGLFQAGADLDQFVTRSQASVEEYRKTFRNLVAEETKNIEVFKASGEVDRRRQIVSDLLVYYTSRDGKDRTTEYRDAQSVDGQIVEKRGERALKLLTKASGASSLEKELEAINHETRRHEFTRHLRGIAIDQLALPKPRDAFQVELVGREQIAGHDVVVLAYRQTAPIPGKESTLPLPKELQNARILRRGRLWLDAQTAQLWRSVWELVVPHPDIAEPLVMIRSESSYGPSRFGILVPERVVFDWLLRFSHPKNGRPSFGLSERTTFSYGSFKRFDVNTDEKIKAPEARGR